MAKGQINYLEDLFSSEVMKWRYGKSLVMFLFFQGFVSFVFCNIFSVIFIQNIWNPLQLISLAFYSIIKLGWLTNLPYQAIFVILLTRIHVHSYETHWWIPERRLHYMTDTLKPKKLFYSTLFVFISSLVIQQYAFQIHPKFSHLVLECSELAGEMCINHNAILITFGGFVFGLKLAYKYFVGNYRVVKFLPCQPTHWTLMKNKLKLRCIMEACSLYDVGLWFVISILCSYMILAATNVISTLLIIADKQEINFLSILYEVFSVQSVMTLVFCLILLAYNIHCFFLTFNQFITEPIEIPVSVQESHTVTTEAEQATSVWKLSNALVSSSSLLQLLAFKHFKDFSEDSTAWGAYYRAQVFTISQPGGHPHNWQGILNPSLNLIRKFTDKLRVNNSIDEYNGSSVVPKGATDINRNQVSKSTFNPATRMKNFLQCLKQYPLFCYLLSDLPDAKNRQIFSEAQSVIWAVQGLSNVVAASFIDDQFGVVQRNAGDILTSLIHLQQVVEKVGRGLPVRKCGPGTNFGSQAQVCPHDAQLRRALRLVLRSSLYTITNTFGDSIREVPIRDDVRSKLESYLTFQEG